MNRVATIPIQRGLADAIQRSQQRLAETQLQLATGKRVTDYAGLGTETVRQLSARTLMARHEAHNTVAIRVGTTLAIYDANLSNIDTAASTLRTEMLTAIGTGRATGLQEAVEQAFHDFRSALNASEGGTPLFAGSRTDTQPFRPSTLADTIGVAAADAFGNDQIRQSARVADGVDVTYGAVADKVGGGLYLAFRTLAEAGTIGDVPTAAQMTAFNEVIGLLDTGLNSVRAANAENGRRQAQVETLGERASDRMLLLEDLIAQNEDADLGQVATDLAQQQTTLRASFSVFSQLSTLSLTDYL